MKVLKDNVPPAKDWRAQVVCPKCGSELELEIHDVLQREHSPGEDPHIEYRCAACDYGSWAKVPLNLYTWGRYVREKSARNKQRAFQGKD